MSMLLVMGVLPIILLMMGFPIFVILMTSSVICIVWIMDLPITMIQIELFGSVDNYKLIAVPVFIFAGAIMAQGGISRRPVDWVISLKGAIRGSLALTTVGACTIFGAAAKESGRHLFIAGVLPGLFIAFVMGVYIYFYARKRNIREGEKFEIARVGRTTKAGGWALGTPLIILGGIYAGVFSPTEAAGIACIYAVLVAMLIYIAMGIARARNVVWPWRHLG